MKGWQLKFSRAFSNFPCDPLLTRTVVARRPYYTLPSQSLRVSIIISRESNLFPPPRHRRRHPSFVIPFEDNDGKIAFNPGLPFVRRRDYTKL